VHEHAQQIPGGDLNGGFRKVQSDAWAGFLAASGQLSWPPPGRFVAAYGQDVMAADNCRQSCARVTTLALWTPRHRTSGGGARSQLGSAKGDWLYQAKRAALLATGRPGPSLAETQEIVKQGSGLISAGDSDGA
jgi:hypothetical protein